jgi:epoxide hydrolase 4
VRKLLGLCLLLGIAGQPAAHAEPDGIAPASESLTFFNAQNRALGVTGEFTEGYIELDDGRLHYVSGGSGKLLVFYHGFPAFWYSWKHQLADLAKDYRVIAVDGLGANLSDKPADVGAYHVSKLARQLRQFTQAIAGDTPYVLVGHDWGGALAWAYAQQYPETLEKLVVLNAPPYNLFLELLQNDPAQREASRYIERLRNLGSEKALDEGSAHRMWQIGYGRMLAQGTISEQEGDRFKNALAQPGALAGGINWYRANIPNPATITDVDYWPTRTSSTPVDSLLIWGETDQTFVPAFMQKLPEYTDQLQIEVLPGVGHSPQLEAPEKVNALIRKFIGS